MVLWSSTFRWSDLGSKLANAGDTPATSRNSLNSCNSLSQIGAIRETVGYDGMKSASRMNNGVVIFLDSIDKVSMVVVIHDTFVQVVLLVNPAKKIILSKVAERTGETVNVSSQTDFSGL